MGTSVSIGMFYTMESNICWLLLALGLVQGAHSLWLPGKCNQFQPMQNFKPEKFLGRWYEYARHFTIYQAGTECNSDMYTDISNSTGEVHWHVNSTGVTGGTGLLNHQYSQTGEVTLANPNDPTHSANLEFNYYARKPIYSVMITDYTRYAVVYFCEEKPFNFRQQYMWVMTRDRHPSQDLIDEAHTDIRARGFLWTTFQTVNQDNCPDL